MGTIIIIIASPIEFAVFNTKTKLGSSLHGFKQVCHFILIHDGFTAAVNIFVTMAIKTWPHTQGKSGHKSS
jgi:hypothetical protein